MTNEERLAKLREQLREVEDAISAIYRGAQSYRIGSRQITRADLSVLYKERDRIESEVRALEYGGGIFKVSVFEGR